VSTRRVDVGGTTVSATTASGFSTGAASEGSTWVTVTCYVCTWMCVVHVGECAFVRVCMGAQARSHTCKYERAHGRPLLDERTATCIIEGDDVHARTNMHA
jgi:hypothetical protein